MSPSLDVSSSRRSSISAPSYECTTRERKQGDHPKHKVHNTGPQATSLLWSAAALLGWIISSSGLILLNKQLMVTDGFKFPMALTAAGQFTSYLGGLALAKANFMSCRPWPNGAFVLRRLLPIVILSALSLVSGNMAYLSLSVAFIQVLKVLLPAVTLAVGVAAGIERLTPALVVSVVLISLGTGYAAVLESQTSHFSIIGLSYFLLSAACEAARTVLVQVLLGKLKYNAVEALVYLSPMIAVCLGMGAILFEWEGLTAHHGGLYKVSCNPSQYLLAATGGFIVNLTTFWAIKATSGLTFKVIGSVKNSFVVCAGVFMGDVISIQQLCGYVVSVAGFIMYMTKSPTTSPADKKTL